MYRRVVWFLNSVSVWWNSSQGMSFSFYWIILCIASLFISLWGLIPKTWTFSHTLLLRCAIFNWFIHLLSWHEFLFLVSQLRAWIFIWLCHLLVDFIKISGSMINITPFYMCSCRDCFITLDIMIMDSRNDLVSWISNWTTVILARAIIWKGIGDIRWVSKSDSIFGW